MKEVLPSQYCAYIYSRSIIGRLAEGQHRSGMCRYKNDKTASIKPSPDE